MNDIDKVRELLGEPPPPSAHITAQALARLEEDMTGRTPTTSTAARFRRRWAVGGGGAALVAAAAAVTLVATSGTGGTEPSRSGGQAPAAAPQSAQTILLAAAHTAETTTETGAYWHFKTLTTSGLRLGPKQRPYVMTVRDLTETWVVRSGQAWQGTRELPKKPASPQDAAAWKADGSPTSWNLGRGDTVSGKKIIEYLKGTPGSVGKVPPPNKFFVCENALSFKEIEALPSTVPALRSRLKGYLSKNDDSPIAKGHLESFLTTCLGSLLSEAPAPPKVRGAAYRALAEMPGVTIEGKVTDELGRRGIALVFTGPRAVDPTYRLVIDPQKALVLSHAVKQPEKFAKLPHKNRSTLFLDIGWTNTKPQIPTAP
jgi:hypothetical protein